MSVLSACALTHQKRASDPTIEECESLCGYWNLNPELLEEQSVLLIEVEPLFIFSSYSPSFLNQKCKSLPVA